MTIETEVPMSADYFILCLMRLDREHYQRIEAVRSAMGDDMEYLLFAPNDELEDLIPEYLSFPEEGLPVKGGVDDFAKYVGFCSVVYFMV